MRFFHCVLVLSLATSFALGQQQAAAAPGRPQASAPAAVGGGGGDFADYDGPPAGVQGDQPKNNQDGEPLAGDGGPDGDGEFDGEPFEEEQHKTRFSDDRFAKLFPSRTQGRGITVRPVVKPKPTLPSFIKSTPPYQKVEISTTPAPRGGLGNRGRVQPQPTQSGRRQPNGSTTTVRPNNSRGRLNNSVTPRPSNGRVQSSTPQAVIRATPAPQQNQNSASAAALARAAAARRAAASRFSRPTSGGGGAPSTGQAQSGGGGGTIPSLPARRS